MTAMTGYRFFALLLPLLPAAGSAPAAAGRVFAGLPPTSYRRAADGGRFLPLAVLTARHGLRPASAPGEVRLVFTRPGLRLVLARGMPLMMIGGKLRRLSAPPRVIAGRLAVPVEIERMLAPRDDPINGIVILDPGHGGKDTGASAGGLREKDVVLDVARRAAARLRARGVTVILTRASDRFVSLPARSRIANRTPGAVFVSIHANSLSRRDSRRRSTHGIETFVLSRRVSEAYRVNRASRNYELQESKGKGWQALTPARERAAMAKLSMNARQQSVRLARLVQQHLVRTTGEPDRGVRQMNLAVLRENYFGPAVLTEIGFISHPPTAARLRKPAYRERLAAAISAAVADFLRSRTGR